MRFSPSGDHLAGRFVSGEKPVWNGPRQCDQSAAEEGTTKNTKNTKQNRASDPAWNNKTESRFMVTSPWTGRGLMFFFRVFRVFRGYSLSFHLKARQRA